MSFFAAKPLAGALSNDDLSPSRALDLGDTATYFFFEKNISIRYQIMRYNGASFGEL